MDSPMPSLVQNTDADDYKQRRGNRKLMRKDSERDSMAVTPVLDFLILEYQTKMRNIAVPHDITKCHPLIQKHLTFERHGTQDPRNN